MDDVDLDRELQAALAATPSPEFVARVRAKIGEAPAPTIVPGWLKPAAAIACVAVVAIVVGLPREEARLEPSPMEPAAVTAGLKPSTTYIAPSATYVAPATPSVVVPTTPSVVVPATPSVVVPTTPSVVVPTTPSVVVPTFRSAKAATEPLPARNETPLPEVIVAAEDVEALVQFLSDTQNHRFVASFDETLPSTSWARTELRVLPIIIEPLDAEPARNN